MGYARRDVGALAVIDQTASESVDQLVELCERGDQGALATEVRAFLKVARKGKRRTSEADGTVTDSPLGGI